MLVSICIPQFNRIQYLIRNLKTIEQQTYDNIEVVVSDDCSTDSTEVEILSLSKTYRYPLVYNKFEVNQGYDRNFRRSIELASGDYCFVLGNDDTLFSNNAIESLVLFLKNYNYPDIGFCNYVEEMSPNKIFRRASKTGLIGSGTELALMYYSAFSFVSGIVYKKSTFQKFNTSIFDNSVYSQIAINFNMVMNGCVLFCFEEHLVLKDILLSKSERANSYRDNLSRSWKNFKQLNGGLTDIIRVLFWVLFQNNKFSCKYGYMIFKKIFRHTYPYWVLDYKKNGALPSAVGLIFGLRPWSINEFKYLNKSHKFEIIFTYLFATIFSLLLPSFLFFKFNNRIYSYFKRR
jgi:glycosyltransferase involved in cell wall biosynthesis